MAEAPPTSPSRPSDPYRGVPRQAKQLAEWVVWNVTRRSSAFWDLHYRARGTSGPGSRGGSARFKADQVNRIVAEASVESVVEFGCGDGYQLGLLRPPRYVGLDVSPNAVRRCVAQYGEDPTKSFFRYDPDAWHDPARVVHADMALSMDVILHLVEDDVFERYLRHLFAAADRLVCIYSTDEPSTGREPPFTRHRCFTGWVDRHLPGWTLAEQVANPDADAQAGIFLYRRAG